MIGGEEWKEDLGDVCAKAWRVVRTDGAKK